jgi:hypothetical protein
MNLREEQTAMRARQQQQHSTKRGNEKTAEKDAPAKKSAPEERRP